MRRWRGQTQGDQRDSWYVLAFPFRDISNTNAISELDVVWDRDIDLLSGGELQRFAIGMVCVQKADVYMFDEPTAGMSGDDVPVVLDLIRDLQRDPANTILLVEH